MIRMTTSRWVNLAPGLQELLSEGNFVDVRICCSDHSPSDGIGAHRAMLAAASPLLRTTLPGDLTEDEMVCIHLPQYTSSSVASVLSILYYGETWLSEMGDQIDTINKLMEELGVELQVKTVGHSIEVVARTKDGDVGQTLLTPQKIKVEPADDHMVRLSSAKVRIKREAKEFRNPEPVGAFPLIQTATLLKCPSKNCNFCTLEIPDLQLHIAECGATPHTSQISESVTDSNESLLEHIDVKPITAANIQMHLKREHILSIKQEPVDPLEKSLELKTEHSKKFENCEMEEVWNAEKQQCDDISLSDSISIASEADQKENVKCDYTNCSYVTNSISSFQAHSIMHQRKTILLNVKNMCPVCEVDFKRTADLKQHLLDEYSNFGPNQVVQCKLDNCTKMFDCKNQGDISKAFYDHIRNDHYGDKYKLKCDQCSFRTVSTSKLKAHLMQHLDERPFKCPQCEIKFRTKPQMLDHIKTIHTKEQPFACLDCNHLFSTNKQLKKHYLSKHTSGNHPCHQCWKIFNTSSSYHSHVKNVHEKSGKRGIVCPTCGLKTSKCQCENVSVVDVVSCPICGKQIFPRNLASHLHYHRQSSLRPYICRECSKTFTHAASLKRHALIHTGVKQFFCKECEKGFYQKSAFETHCKSHTNSRLFCETCRKPFLTQYLLNFHIKSRSSCRIASNPIVVCK